MLDFFDWLQSFLSSGIIGIIQTAIGWLLMKFAIWKFESMLWALEFSWGIGKSVVESLNISSHLASAFSGLDSKVLNALTFFRVPEAINIILSSLAAKFVMKFIPFA